MRDQYFPGVLFLILLSGCVQSPTTPPPSLSTSTITVLPPNNRTDDPLIVTSDSFWPFASPRSQHLTIADVLAAEARTQLTQRGFTVISAEATESAIGPTTPQSPEEAITLVSHGKLTGSALYIEIKRWEADDSSVFRPTQVLVALDASLIEAATGRVVWTAHRPLRPAPTPGAASPGMADMIAAHAVIEDLLASWGSASSTS
jgi:PBP1b-binding outer membrane lipoprotein LpoB